MRSGNNIGRSLERKTVFFALELVLVMFGVGPYAEVLQPSPVNTTGVPTLDLIGWLPSCGGQAGRQAHSQILRLIKFAMTRASCRRAPRVWRARPPSLRPARP